MISIKQDPPNPTKFAAIRRSLHELRHRISKRGRTKPPDWFLDKFTGAQNSQNQGAPSEDIHTNRLCSRLSVDPSLPSHYRVSIKAIIKFRNKWK